MKTLGEYNQKRNFKKTPEPGAVLGKRKVKKLSFVVQEHHASHLHYDFRLEMDGVLKSWAVPKGPSADPKVKRLAMQVEDHPLAYGKFAGNIPEHEYGGGEVLIWDEGTWEPSSEYHQGLKKGHLDFTLKGKRMKGMWTLIRTGAQTGKPAWLLFKRSDEYAGKDALFHPIKEYGSKNDPKKKQLAKTTKTAGKIKRKSSSVKLKFIEPQLCLLVDAPPKEDHWVHEIKFDGYRIQVHLQNGKAKLFTRSGQDWTHKYQTLAKELEALDVEDAILDGEVVVMDATGKSDFQALQLAMKAKNQKNLKYYVFDLLELNGSDLREETLIERKEKLESIIPKKSALIKYSEHLETDGGKMLKASCEQDLEGIVSKQKDSIYNSGRGKSWVKSKCTKRQEFVIGGYSDPEGSRERFGSLLLGVYEGGKFRYVGRCGTGFNRDTIEVVWQKLKKIETKASPFTLKSPLDRDIHWLKPNLVAEVSFANWTTDDILRVPVFHGLREDKDPKDIKKEVEKPVQKTAAKKPTGSAARKAASATRTQTQSATEIATDPISNSTTRNEPSTRLTHPDKIIYPKEKLTKQDVADYYRAIAKYILPHIKDRPLSLLRCPEGTEKTCFFQKHFSPAQRGSKTHPTVHEIMIQEHSGKKGYSTVDSIEGILSLVQMGGFEFHAWGCRAPDIEHPDQIVMDFDPDPSVNFAKVKDAAFELKKTLDHLGLESFVKVTGGKGLHVHIPVDPIYSWDDIKEFSKVLAQHMEENAPKRYTSVLSKSARTGKIFVDYLRNGRSSTAVVPYSLRARPKSSVALPISWKELKTLRNPAEFTLEKTLSVLKKRKQDPWKGILELKQKIKLLKAH